MVISLSTVLNFQGSGREPVDGLESLDVSLLSGGRFLTYEPAADTESPLLKAYDPDGRLGDGRSLFYRDWLDAESGSPPPAGPHYDRSTCSACHLETAAARDVAHRMPTLVARPATAWQEQRYGHQITTRAQRSADPEAVIHIKPIFRIFTYPDGEQRMLRRPVGRIQEDDGQWAPVRLRAAPLLFGWGLLERVSLSTIEHFHDPFDRDGDGISGRMVLPLSGNAITPDKPAIFGWMNSHTSLKAQIAAALANDMGVESAQSCGKQCAVEISAQDIAALTEFVRHLGVPRRGSLTNSRGSVLFGKTGCSDCHVPAHITEPGGNPALSEQIVWAYSDLVLHDMGSGLADPGPQPPNREWRTAPLWGVGTVERELPQRGFLHDGRAADIEEAILWHGGEAASAVRAFSELSRQDREALLAFVRSL